MPRHLWCWLGLLACSGDKDGDSQDSGVSEDTGNYLPADSGDSGGDPVDTGGSGAADSVMTVSVAGGSDGLLVGVAQYWMSPEGLTAGDVLSSGIVMDGTAELALPEPQDSDLDDPGTGALVGNYAIFVRQDENGDGAHDEGETIVGVAETRLLYIAGALDSESEALGLELGWNALWFDLAGSSDPIRYELDAVPAELNLEVRETIEIGGSSDVPETPADPIRLTAKPLEVDVSKTVLSSLILDIQMTPSWSVELSGAPDASHIIVEDGILPSALERLAVYVDIDESESLSSGDESLYGVCSEGSPVLLIWMDPIGTVADAIPAPVAGVQIGWSLWAFDPKGLAVPRTLEDSERMELVAESSCSLE